jgi:glycosyltransferase involved in cell wall biosynthesis
MAHQSMRIVRIITAMTMSGPTLQSILLTDAMRRRDHQTTLIVGREGVAGDNMAHVAQQYDVDPIRVPALHQTMNPLQLLQATRTLTHHLRQLQPDIVHTHMTTAGLVGRIAAKLAGVPVVVHTLHEHPFHGYYNWTQTITFIWVERFGAYLSDSLVTLSSGLMRELTETYHITSRKRMTVLPLGYDLQACAHLPRHCQQFRSAWGIPADAPLIGIVGRLQPVKNHALFLRAARQVLQQRPQAYFAIVGDGELYADLLTQAQDIRERVIFTGWQQNTPPIFSDLDVLVNTSLNEGTPAPIIEALAAGCPVVATAVGGVPDLLDRGRFGRLVPPADVDALTQAILTTLDQPPEMTSAQTAIRQRYGIDRLALEIDSLYRGLLAKRHAHQPTTS